MNGRLKLFAILDCITFLIFLSPRFNYILSTYDFSFSIADKVSAIWQILILFFFLFTSYSLWFKAKLGLICSFILIPFRVVFLYFSFDFLSYLAYYLGFKDFVSTAIFQHYWFYILLILEGLRYLDSVYAYYKLSLKEE
ncbi:hypothetical protein A5893_15080 [Pedobacter psychrophilus]|uniref:Uncharacterized protein n=1 Tax=Pedobacter psychrophilus TaxID=1826909 RepID=A0A179DAP5_9SPHI|nr:hypothetical protein [Pedobacter psychrophilus]OAQ38125.1 hypothetical protein A5893_15080 [Pedobacter psychrophilus]